GKRPIERDEIVRFGRTFFQYSNYLK
ncbi:hypothetical protein CCACVL1_03051, partial [Corchorus capsularis]